MSPYFCKKKCNIKCKKKFHYVKRLEVQKIVKEVAYIYCQIFINLVNCCNGY